MTNNIMRKVRFAMTIAATAFAMAVFTACANTGDEGVQPKEIVATKAAVTTTTTAKTEAKDDELTTFDKKADAKPDAKTTTTTTTEPVEDSEPEVEVTTMADNPDGMYPMEECFRRVIEESTNSKVISINIIEGLSSAITEDGHKFMLAPGEISVYYNGELTNINDYVISESFLDEFDGMVSYSPNADQNG